jgi:MaoC like domain
MLTAVHSAGELVWEETSTFLRRGRGDVDAPASGLDRLDVVKGSGVEWSLGGDLGRRYAAVSGDRNPIHLYGLTAKAFGFPRQIAHGMWSKARCLAALEGRLPEAVTVEVAFKKPILLPGRVAFGSAREADGYAFSLTDPTTGAPHLVGAARATAR